MFAAKMLQAPYLAALEAVDVADLRRRLIDFTNSLGFGTASAMAVIDHSLTHSEFHNIGKIADGYSESFNSHFQGISDPVMQHTKTSLIPILWDQTTYVDAGKGELWEHQAQFGYTRGIALAFHFPDGRHFAFGAESPDIISSDSKKLTSIVGKMQLFAIHAQEAAFRILAPQNSIPEESFGLTAREKEVLRWTIDGRTAASIGDALNISTRTVVFHLQNATRKLGCINKHQAVLKALRLRLLS